MASRTKQKEEARQRRMEEERARAEQAQKRRRMQMLGGVLVVAIAAIVVAIAISAGGPSKGGIPKKTSQQQKIISTISALLNGIPQNGNVLGNPNAPITMTYYGDYECPICQEFTLYGGFPQLVRDQVRTGHVKVLYSPFETATRTPSVFKLQQVAGLAAGQQHKFWYYTELFYHEQGAEGTGYVTESYLDGLARQVPGLNYSQWLSSRKDSSLLAQVISAENSGLSRGITGTPTLVFRGPTGKQSQPSAAVPAYSDLEQAIRQVQ
jgi:protein-disulfide isomerase